MKFNSVPFHSNRESAQKYEDPQHHDLEEAEDEMYEEAEDKNENSAYNYDEK